MKKIFILLLASVITASPLFSQEEINNGQKELEEKMKEIYGKKKKGEEVKEETAKTKVVSKEEKKKPKAEESSSVYKDFFLTSLSKDLYLTFPSGENISRRKMAEMKILPTIKVNKSVIMISSMVESLDVEVKKKKIKGKFLTENYASGKETKVSSLKRNRFLASKSIGDGSNINIGEYDRDAGGLIIYLTDDKYDSISFGKGAKLKEVVTQLPEGASGFVLQTSNDSEFLYSLTGTYDGSIDDLNVVRKIDKSFEKL